MSYGVHIKRPKAQDSHGITLEEWLAYVRSDPEMHHVGEAVTKTSKGDTVRYDAPGMAHWIDSQTGQNALFNHHKCGGKVSVGNPSCETLAKMFKVAKALQGVVQGDNGERYDASGDPSANLVAMTGDPSPGMSSSMSEWLMLHDGSRWRKTLEIADKILNVAREQHPQTIANLQHFKQLMGWVKDRPGALDDDWTLALQVLESEGLISFETMTYTTIECFFLDDFKNLTLTDKAVGAHSAERLG